MAQSAGGEEIDISIPKIAGPTSRKCSGAEGLSLGNVTHMMSVPVISVPENRQGDRAGNPAIRPAAAG